MSRVGVVPVLLLALGSCKKGAADSQKSVGGVSSRKEPQELPRTAPTKAAPTITISGRALELDACALMVDGEVAATTNLDPPCRFVEIAPGRPQIVPTKAGMTLLIASSRPHPDYPGRCRTSVTPVFVPPHGSVQVSTSSQTIVSCLQDGADTKMFHAFAEEFASGGAVQQGVAADGAAPRR